MSEPKKFTQADFDKVIAACTPEAGLDASDFMRALLLASWHSGNQFAECAKMPAVHDEVKKLVTQLKEKAGVEQ